MCRGDETVKILLLTVAGMSSRFSESIGQSCLKCIYYEKSPEESLLYRMLYQNPDFDRIVIVGGFRFDELTAFVHEHLSALESKITLVYNENYADFGSGYSLYRGLQEVVDTEFSEVLFAEGDLYVDHSSFSRVYESPHSVVTYNRDSILANKAVAFYFDLQHGIHYIYDTSHSALEINEPFLSIFNSGQIWKFAHPEHMRQVYSEISESQWQGTNLVFIQKYFESLSETDYEMVPFLTWLNCNTVLDFRKIGKEGTFS